MASWTSSTSSAGPTIQISVSRISSVCRAMSGGPLQAPVQVLGRIDRGAETARAADPPCVRGEQLDVGVGKVRGLDETGCAAFGDEPADALLFGSDGVRGEAAGGPAEAEH